MNIGIRLHDTAPGTLGERLGFAKAQGFSCVHLALSKTLPDFAMEDAVKLLTPELAAQLRFLLDANQLDCAVLGCYLSVMHPDPEELKRTQDIYRAHLRFSRLMGAGVVGTETPPVSGVRFDKPAPESDEALETLIRNLRPLVRCAEEEDAVLAVEPVYRHVASTPERAQRLLEALPSDHLKIILDSVNLIGPEQVGNADEIIADAIRRLGDKVCVLHMKDFRLSDDRKEVLSMACGLGDMHYEQLLRFGGRLPMTLEDTKPENAEAARLHLEQIAASL